MNQIKAGSVLLVCALLACGSSLRERESTGSSEAQQVSCMPFDVPDSLVSPAGQFVARTSVANGGLRRLTVVDRRQAVLLMIVDDIGNLRWLPNEAGLLYAVSPVHGVPGIYMFDTRLGTTRRVVAARHTTDPGYPDGSDLLVLCSARQTPQGRVVVQYLAFSHIDSVNLRVRPLTGAAATDTLP